MTVDALLLDRGHHRVHWFNNHRLLEPIGDIPPTEYEGLYWLERAANDTVGLKESGLQ